MSGKCLHGYVDYGHLPISSECLDSVNCYMLSLCMLKVYIPLSAQLSTQLLTVYFQLLNVYMFICLRCIYHRSVNLTINCNSTVNPTMIHQVMSVHV